jgi:hypothetical protein
MSEPRDYRDNADIDEALDIIRTSTRTAARMLFRTCLDTAYAQGRSDLAASLAPGMLDMKQLQSLSRVLVGMSDGDDPSGSV